MTHLVGFDIGSLNSCICVPWKNGIDVIENNRGQRQTPTCVAFEDQQRIFGSDAMDLNEANVKCTVENFKQFIGRIVSLKTFKKIQKDTPYDLERLEDGRLQITVLYRGKAFSFVPEQILAMHLANLKKIASQFCSSEVGGIVLSVPLCYSEQQRRALVDACCIAGLKCESLLNDTTAIATYYGLFNSAIPAEDEPSKRVAFISVGHMHTQVAVCAFNRGRFEILSTSCDPELGGWHFTKVLYDHFADISSNQYGFPIEPRTYNAIHLMNECAHIKVRLSRVAGPIPVNIQGFEDGRILNTSISQEIFDNLSKGLLNRLRDTLGRCMKSSRLKPVDVDSVEMVGGGFRVMAIRNLIRDFFGRDGSTSLNGNEIVAYGCALHAARLSSNQRVKDFIIENDTNNVAKCYLSREQIRKFSAIEIELTHMDQQIHETLCAKNDYESRIYRILNKIKNSDIPLTASERCLCLDRLNQMLYSLQNGNKNTKNQYELESRDLTEDERILSSLAELRCTVLEDLIVLSRNAEEYGKSLHTFLSRVNKLRSNSTESVRNYHAVIEDEELQRLMPVIRIKWSQIEDKFLRLVKPTFGLQPLNKLFSCTGIEQAIDSLIETCQTSCYLHSVIVTGLKKAKYELLSVCLHHVSDEIVPPNLMSSSPFFHIPELSALANATKQNWCDYFCSWCFYILPRGYDTLAPELPDFMAPENLAFIFTLTSQLVKNRFIMRRLSKNFIRHCRTEDTDKTAIRVVIMSEWVVEEARLSHNLEEVKSSLIEMGNICQRPRYNFRTLDETISALEKAVVSAQMINDNCIRCSSQLLQPELSIAPSIFAIKQWATYHDVVQQALLTIANQINIQKSQILCQLLQMPLAIDWSPIVTRFHHDISAMKNFTGRIEDNAKTINDRCREHLATLTNNSPGHGGSH